jgi:acyl-CoA reductase-like NAD-dependent aldehyde dehydrogenase
MRRVTCAAGRAPGASAHRSGWHSAEAKFGTSPKGVVLILGAWNFPFALMLAPLVPAIAAGNCVIMRPSDKVHTNAVIARLIADVFDEDHVAFVEGDVDVAERLLELPFDHIFFTGSSRVGRRIMAAASRTLASVTLELGGKCPVIVDQSADVEGAAASICWGKFVSAGQACVAPDYVFVHTSQRAALVAALNRRLTAFYGTSEDDREQSHHGRRDFRSGASDTNGLAGFQAFAHARSVFTQHVTGAYAFYPPYGSGVKRLVEWMRRIRG